MNSPALENPNRFDPIFVTEEDLEDLSSFTGMTPTACLDRLRSYSSAELGDAWRRTAPTTPDQIIDFYRSSDLYIWELMQWHASVSRRPYWQALARLCELYPPEKGYSEVYDFGCGIGTDALFLASRGYSVSLADVPGPTLSFARHRFARRGLPAEFCESTTSLPKPPRVFDVAVCFDVFEHLPDPLSAAAQLVKSLRMGGVLLQRSGFFDDGDHPCHLGNGNRKFEGLRWHIHLAGLGLRGGEEMMYVKSRLRSVTVQRIRFALWRSTGLWITHVSPR